VGVPNATAVKVAGDAWSWDALTRNPSVTPATVLSARDAACEVPPYAAAAPDSDAATPGLQHELKLSLRGAHAFSDVQLFTSPATGVARAPTPLSLDTALLADGFFTGDAPVVYEVTMTAADAYAWCRYSATPRAADVTAWSSPAAALGGAVGAWVALDQGVFIRFETDAGKSAGLSWVFTAYPSWSTPFSPVAWLNDTTLPTPVPLTRLLPSGTPRASDTTRSWVYTVTVGANPTNFTWRKWPYGADATSADATAASASLAVSDSSAAVELDAGVSVSWSAPAAVLANNVWRFTAFAGHAVTFGAASAMGAASSANAAGDPGPPVATDAAGATLTAAYTGVSAATFTLTVGAGGNSFTWSLDGGTASADTPMSATPTPPTPLTQGVCVTWPTATSGYAAGHVYTFWAAPVPSSTAPPAPPPGPLHGGQTFTALGAFAPGGVPPSADASVTVEFLSATHFAFRVNTGPLSAGLEALAPPATVLLGDTGLALAFSAAGGWTTGVKHVLWVTSFVPRLDNATAPHGGTRAEPAIGPAIGAVANRGYPAGLAVAYASNVGAATLGISASPTPGFAAAGTSQGMVYQTSPSGGLSANLPEGYPASVAPGAYPVLYVKILGAPRVGGVSGPLPRALTITGTYTYTASRVYTLQSLGNTTMQWRFAPLGGMAGAWTGPVPFSSGVTDSGLTLTFTSNTYPNHTTWTFIASAGHSYAMRREGSAKWGPETVIAPGLVELCCGVSVAFDALTGYTPGDQWVLLPFALQPSGVYSGEADATFEVQVLPGSAGAAPNAVSAPAFTPAAASSTSGTAAALTVGGARACMRVARLRLALSALACVVFLRTDALHCTSLPAQARTAARPRLCTSWSSWTTPPRRTPSSGAATPSATAAARSATRSTRASRLCSWRRGSPWRGVPPQGAPRAMRGLSPRARATPSRGARTAARGAARSPSRASASSSPTPQTRGRHSGWMCSCPTWMCWPAACMPARRMRCMLWRFWRMGGPSAGASRSRCRAWLRRRRPPPACRWTATRPRGARR
jgi:hypothetical protein